MNIAEVLKYKIIKSKPQYDAYCSVLEELVSRENQDSEVQDEIELLTYLIEKWDEEHDSMLEADPIELLQNLMTERNLKAKDLTSLIGVTKGHISDILNYKKGLSKEMIRSLSALFKVSQEAFNRPYKLQTGLRSIEAEK